jgi:hypothetical protein
MTKNLFFFYLKSTHPKNHKATRILELTEVRGRKKNNNNNGVALLKISMLYLFSFNSFSLSYLLIFNFQNAKNLFLFQMKVCYRGCTTGTVVEASGGTSGTVVSSTGLTYTLCNTAL